MHGPGCRPAYGDERASGQTGIAAARIGRASDQRRAQGAPTRPIASIQSATELGQRDSLEEVGDRGLQLSLRARLAGIQPGKETARFIANPNANDGRRARNRALGISHPCEIKSPRARPNRISRPPRPQQSSRRHQVADDDY
jgi:hypothetical protein